MIFAIGFGYLATFIYGKLKGNCGCNSYFITRKSKELIQKTGHNVYVICRKCN